jgi:hypothetical protein
MNDSLRCQQYKYRIFKLKQDTLILQHDTWGFDDKINTFHTKYDTLVASKNQKMP